MQSVAQTEMEHTSDRSNAQVVGLKRRKVHQYEDVENPRPDEHTEEPVSDSERTLDHEYNELEHQEKTNAHQKINGFGCESRQRQNRCQYETAAAN